jgi:hypothetical protein
MQFLGEKDSKKNLQKGVYDSSIADSIGCPALTLSCGHSICKECFEIHSDPKSKDSLVFCEDCKSETKNRNLKELKTIRNISSFHKASRDHYNQIRGLLEDSARLIENSKTES